METQQIRYFLAACQTLNFSRAAERCEVSVPTLSKAIQKLEEELGGHLFRRERHLTHLTDLGRLMQGHFTTAQQALEAARTDATRYTDLTSNKLKMGIFASMPADQLTTYLTSLAKIAPDIELNLWEANCEELGQALLANEVDVAITSAPDIAPELRAIPLFREAYFIAFPTGHRFAAMDAIPLRELGGENYVKRLYCEFPSNFRKLGVPLPYESVNVRYVTEREDWVQNMVRSGLGVTVMPEFMPILPGFETRRVIEPEVYRQISLVTVAGRPHSAAVAAVVKVARSVWGRSEEGLAASA